MKPKLYELDVREVYPRAFEFVRRSCGLDRSDDPRKRRMLQECVSAFRKVEESIRLKALLGEWPPDAYRRGSLLTEGGAISCSAFSQIDPECVKGIRLALATAGSWAFTGTAKERVYWDIWGTAFAESARVFLEEEMRKTLDAGESLSNPFGPGYYGMKTAAAAEICALLKSENVGVSVSDGGMMTPEKTIAALYFITEADAVLPPLTCADCLGDVKGCRMCEKHFTP